MSQTVSRILWAVAGILLLVAGMICLSNPGVALATLFSRILGLGRVMLEARVLGGGTLASAWVLAFMVPNLFRRILGEGALGSALSPLLTGIEEKEGDREVRYNLTVVFAALSKPLAKYYMGADLK